jgi:drug/metabolite transporter (DMT)-like permease
LEGGGVITPVGIEISNRANVVGAFWMILSMAGFALEDTFVKSASRTLPVEEILVLFGLGGAAAFAGVARISSEPLFVREVLSRPMQVRMLFEIVGRAFYTLALSMAPLAVNSIILQATPIVVVGSAALIFGETVGWRRWTAISLGLIGVIVIIQPGTSEFSALSVLAVIGMFGFAGRDLASRVAPASLNTAILGFYGFLAVFIAGLLVSVWSQARFGMPDLTTIFFLSGSVLAGVTGYACLMKAMRTGEISAVTPFRYTRLLFGIALGVVVFGEQLTLSMAFGSGLIVLSGLFILWRSKQTRASR